MDIYDSESYSPEFYKYNYEIEQDPIFAGSVISDLHDPMQSKPDSETSVGAPMDETKDNNELQITILHKTRGGKGKWSIVETMELIRVTKGIGKRLRLDIDSEFFSQGFDWNYLFIRLYDVHEDGDVTEIDFTMDTKNLIEEAAVDGKKKVTAQVELKVYNLCKNLQFHVTYQVKDANINLMGKGKQFSTHDSGKQRKKLPSINISINDMKKIVVKKESHDLTKMPPHASDTSINESHTDDSGPSSPSRSTSCEDPSDESLAELTTTSEDSGPLFMERFEPRDVNFSYNDDPQSSRSFSKDDDVDTVFDEGQILYNQPDLSYNMNTDNVPMNMNINDNSMNINNTAMCVDNSSMKKRKMDQMTILPLSENTFTNYCDGSLDVNGIVRAQNFVQYSDVRLKTNIEDITDALTIISNLQGKRYQWKSSQSDETLTGGKKVLGLIAQEVRRILPEAVYEDGEGYLSINYTDIVPILIEAMKQHVNNYKNDHVQLREEIEELKSKVDSIANNSSKEYDPWGLYNKVLEALRLFTFQTEEPNEPVKTIPYEYPDDRTPFTASSITFPSSHTQFIPPVETISKDEELPQSAPIRMLNCITNIAKNLVNTPKEQPKPQIHTIYRNCNVKAKLISPGYSRTPLQAKLNKRDVKSAVVISISSWLLWSKSEINGLSPQIADSEREALQMTQRAIKLLEASYPGVSVEYLGMEMRSDVYIAVEDICYEIFKQVESPDGTVKSLQQKLENADIVWFIGHSEGAVPAVFVCDRLLKAGVISASVQMISILSLGGTHLDYSRTISSIHPNPLFSSKSNPFPNKKDQAEYKESMKSILEANVSVLTVSAYKDLITNLSSSMADFVIHPNILRSLMIHQEYQTEFEPQHTFKKAHNFVQELLLFALELKNKHQFTIDALKLSDVDDIDYDAWVKRALEIPTSKLRTILFDQDTVMPATFAGLFYDLQVTFNAFSTWGFKFHKITKYLKEGIQRHYQIPYLDDAYLLSLEWMVDSWKPLNKPCAPSIKEESELSFAYQLKCASKIYPANLAKLESSFKYWKPTHQMELKLQKDIQQTLQWAIRQRFFGDYVDGFADLVNHEKEKKLREKVLNEETNSANQ